MGIPAHTSAPISGYLRKWVLRAVTAGSQIINKVAVKLLRQFDNVKKKVQPNNPSKPAACTVILTRFMQQNRQSAQPIEADAACKFPPQRLPSKNLGFSMACLRAVTTRNGGLEAKPPTHPHNRQAEAAAFTKRPLFVCPGVDAVQAENAGAAVLSGRFCGRSESKHLPETYIRRCDNIFHNIP